jgi:dihydropyrimidinase
VISDVTLRQTLDAWLAKAEGKAVIDYGFHIAITDLPDGIMDDTNSMYTFCMSC